MVVKINPSVEKGVAPKAQKSRAVASKKVAAKNTPRFRIMPLTITMLSLVLVLKMYDIYAGTQLMREATFVAPAQAASPPAETAKADGKKNEKDKGNVGENKISLGEIKALKKLEAQTKYSQIELDLLQSLAKRRDELDAREKELSIKSTVLDSTEKRINSRITEMKALEVQVKTLMESYNDKQSADVQSLVKIYESMKAVDAAAIFNELEMPILLSVIDAMSERKVAPVLAAMDPKRAREVTEELAQVRKVKAIPDGASAALK